MFDRRMLNPEVAPREVFGWSMFDFANSGYTTVVLTAVFNAYFVSVVARHASWATFAWTLALALSYFVVMLMMPVLGAWADARAKKKFVLLISTIVCVAATASLGSIGAGDLWLAVLVIVISNVAFQVGEAITAAFLPELARPASMGKVSGWGWSFGYFGGMLSLGLSILWVSAAGKRGETAEQFVPVTMWITAAVFGLASLVTFALLRERGQAQARAGAGLAQALARLAATWRDARRYRDFRQLMWCAVFYQAGIAVVVALAAIFAEEVMHFTQAQTMILVFVVNIASAIGAFGFGYAQDLLGHRLALSITLIGWIIMTLIAAATHSHGMFWVAATLAGLCMGSSQSCGRAFAGALSPSDRLAEFYGLWAFATRIASIIGPITYGAVTWLTNGNHRLAILTTSAFFVIGLLILRTIDVRRGEVAAGRAP